jgi:hypothetical protein
MTRRAGSADLPLHGGHVLKWLAERMTRLAAVMSQAIVHHYGRNELLRRLCHAFRFQSLLLAAGGRLRSRPIAEFTYENAINLPALGAEGNPGDARAYNAMTMLPVASYWAWALGGTIQVASYSSTMSGPTRLEVRFRSARLNTGVSIQPCSSPK